MLYVNFKDVGAWNIAPAKIGQEKDRQNLNALQSTCVPCMMKYDKIEQTKYIYIIYIG